MNKLSLSIIALVFIPFTAFGGPSVSGGGGGGRLNITTRFSQAGDLVVTVFSPTGGSIETVIKYFSKAGAVQAPGAQGWATYQMPSVAGAIIIANSPADEVALGNRYQLNLTLKIADLQEVSSGATQTGAPAAMVSFSGAFAEALYVGMDKSGLASQGETIGQDGKPIAPIYRDGPLYCEKRASSVCSIQI